MNILSAGLKSAKTTSVAVLLFLAALFTALGALFDADPETVADWQKVGELAVIAVGLLLARDADVSSEKSGVK